MKKIKNLLLLSVIALMIMTAMSCTNVSHNFPDIILIDSITLSQGNSILSSKTPYQIQSFHKDSLSNMLLVSLGDKQSVLSIQRNEQIIDPIELKHLEAKFKKELIEPNWLYVNNDSIFALSAQELPYQLILTDTSGKEKMRWTLPPLQKNGFPVFLDINTFTQPFHYNPENNEFTFTIHRRYYSREDATRFNELDSKVVCRLEDNHILTKTYFGKTPAEHQPLFLGYNGKIRSTLMNGFTLLSYTQADSIYSFQNGKKIKAYYAGTKKFDRYEEAFDYRKSSNRTYILERTGKKDRYTDLIAGSNYLIRLVMRKNPVQVNQQGEVTHAQRAWSMIILDKELNYLSEIDMTYTDCNFSAIFPCGENQFLSPSKESPNKFYKYEIVR